MSPASRTRGRGGRRAWLGVLLGACFVAALIWTTLAQSSVECEVCLDFRGASVCRTVAADSADDALAQAVSNACGILARGVTQGLECQRTPLRSQACRAR